MKIEFSEHSKDQNKIRKISISAIKKAVFDPDKIITSFRGRKLFQKKVGGKILEVVVKIEGKKIIVITQYYLEK